jgi:kumamolisin
MSENEREMPGSVIPHTEATRRIRDVDPDAQLAAYVYLMPEPLEPGGAWEAETPEQRRERWTARHADDIREITAFAAGHGLRVESVMPDWRRVCLAGTAAQFGAAFQVSLGEYGNGEDEFRSYDGALSVPESLAGKIESVCGLDTRRMPRRRSAGPLAMSANDATAGFLPTEIAEMYRFPASANGAGQTIGLIEETGGYREGDLALAFAAMGLPVPQIVFKSVDGATNNPGPDKFSLEVSMDIQIAGGMANGAKLVVYMTPGTDLFYLPAALMQAVLDDVNRPTVISISSGPAESQWDNENMTTMKSVLTLAAAKNITVVAASGDLLAPTWELNSADDDNRVHVAFPASSPLVLGCGGTSIGVSGSSITTEVALNTGTAGTGGGISEVFPVPGFQQGLPLPPNVNGGPAGRGVPDVAGTAVDWRIYKDGGHGNEGGTSAVAPMWAALTARLNQLMPPGQNLGCYVPLLYQYPQVLRDITEGNNRPDFAPSLGYDAGPGWDACTGLGVPDGGALAILVSRTARLDSPIATARWLDSSQHIRLYCLNAQSGIDEYCWDNGGWASGGNLTQAGPNSKLAAVAWADENGQDPHVRVYYQDAQNMIREYMYDYPAGWQGGATLPAAASGSGLAVLQWSDGDGVHLRVFYQNPENWIREHCFDGNEWQPGGTLAAAAPGSNLAASMWTDVNGSHVRVYYLDGDHAIREHCYDGGGWQPGTTSLPTAGGDIGLTAGLWTDGNGVHIRLYYVDAQAALREYRFDGNEWQPGATLPAAAPGSVAASLWTDENGTQVRVYYHDLQHVLLEYGYEAGGWQHGRLVLPPA